MAALDVDTDGMECVRRKCDFVAENPVAFLQVENKPLFHRGMVLEDCTAIDTADARSQNRREMGRILSQTR